MLNDITQIPPHLLLDVFQTLGRLFGRAHADPEPAGEVPQQPLESLPVKQVAFLLPSVKQRRAA